MLRQKNTKKQGDVGTAFAVSYFARNGQTVCIPLSDSQSYDLIVDDGKAVNRVQVKTTTVVNGSGFFVVELRTISNTRGRKLDIRKFSAASCELLFIVTEDSRMFCIPARELDGKSRMVVDRDFVNYEVR